MSLYVQFDPEGRIYRLVEGHVDGDAADLLVGLPNDPLHPRFPGSDYTPGVHDDHDELLRGYGGNDRIFGGDGEDVLYGEKGNDRLDGGTGFDWLVGGPGNDVLIDPDVGVTMNAGVGDDVLRCVMVGDGPDQFVGSELRGGKGADQFRVNAVQLGAIDDVHYGQPWSVVVDDFSRAQGDRIDLHGRLTTGEVLSRAAVFDLLDTNDDHKLSAADGSTALGRVTWDGASTDSDTGITHIGALHLQLGETALVVEHTAQLTAHDFLL